MLISLLIPLYNEEKQIPLTLDTLIPMLRDLPVDYELILVDDGSKDKTWELINQASIKNTRIIGLRFSRNFGKEAAICAALDKASGDAVILIDGDLQHPPELIPDMVKDWMTGEYDIIEGIKATRGKESVISRLNARLFYGLFHRLSGYDLRNASDYKLLDRRVVDEWKNLEEHDTFFRGLSAWLGFRRKTFTFKVAARQTGISKWSLLRLAKLSINAITSFSTAPLQFITFIGILLLAGSFIIAIQTLVNWFSGQAASGFTTVILLQLLIGGSIMISLGLIGIYVARIFTEVKGRPRYIIAQQTSPSGSLASGNGKGSITGKNNLSDTSDSEAYRP